MEIRLLGPVEVWSDGAPVDVQGRKPRALLAVLAVHVGQVVSADRLMEVLWGEQPPDKGRAGVHSYVSTLRRSLGEGVILRKPAGYQLELDPTQVDLHAFQFGVEAGLRSLAGGLLADAAAQLATALALWRGSALDGVAGEWAEQERSRLAEQRLAAVEARIDAELRGGQGPRLVAELTSLVNAHPLRERARGHLMLALYQAGRQAEALQCYEQGRKLLDDELGVEPGAELRTVHSQVLRGEVPAPPTTVAEAVTAVPGQLPAAMADFTGRRADAIFLADRLTADTGTTTVCVIAGKPGSGKSSLAAQVARQVRGEFDGGQLYANLRGVHARPADPADVLARFLRAFGVPVADVPDGVDERTDLYRTLVADRRVLVVLDDASDEAQVRPLLPGGDGCAVIVTSRRRLPALAGASHLDLPVFSQDEAVELLGRLVGTQRVADDPGSAEDLVRLCGFLPLAVRITGARLAARPQWPVRHLVDRLREKHRLLDELVTGDLEVRGSLLLSYEGQSARDQSALRHLGFLGTPEFAPWLVSALLDVTVSNAESVLERLADNYLLDSVGPDRYQLHDLTRVFAAERAADEDPVSELHAAVERTVLCAVTLVDEATARMPRGSSTPFAARGRDSQFDTAAVSRLLADPLSWFDAERSVFVTLVERASELGLVTASTSLAAALSSSVFTVRNQFDQWWQTHAAALRAADLAGDEASKASLFVGLGRLRLEQDRYDEAADYLAQALEIHQRLGDAEAIPQTKLDIVGVLRERGELAEALRVLREVLPALTDPMSVARAHHGLGLVFTEQGDYPQALAECRIALAGYEQLSDRFGQAMVVRSIGITHRAAGDLAEAERECSRALGMLHELGDTHMLVYATQALAKVRIRQGRGAAERDRLRDGLQTCNQLQDSFGQALLLRTLGELELAAGRYEDAEQHLERSVQWWTALSLPLWRARTLRDLSTVLAATGRTERSDAAWAEAHTLFTRHGSHEAVEARPQVTGGITTVG